MPAVAEGAESHVKVQAQVQERVVVVVVECGVLAVAQAERAQAPAQEGVVAAAALHKTIAEHRAVNVPPIVAFAVVV